jgi:hypothetical protein
MLSTGEPELGQAIATLTACCKMTSDEYKLPGNSHGMTKRWRGEALSVGERNQFPRKISHKNQVIAVVGWGLFSTCLT